MRLQHSYLVACLVMVALALANPHPSGSMPPASVAHLWSQRFGDVVDQIARDVIVDDDGNIVITGQFDGTVDFGGGPLVSAGSFDILLAKFDNSGTYMWGRRFGETGNQVGISVAVDESSNIIMAGYFSGDVDLGGGTITSAGLNDIFVAKYDPSGTHLWSVAFGDASEQLLLGVTVDNSGNVIAAGHYDGVMDFGAGILPSSGGRDIFLLKLDANGGHLWGRRFGEANNQFAFDVTTDLSRNIAITGYFLGDLDFGGNYLTSSGSNDIYVATFDEDGNHRWSKRAGDNQSQFGRAVATDNAGNVFVSGYFEGSMDFGGSPLSSGGDRDVLLCKFDVDGNHLWSRGFGAAEEQVALAVGVDGNGAVIITGEFKTGIDFGAGTMASAGNIDTYLAKFDTGGNHLWSQRYGDFFDQAGRAIAFDTSNDVVFTGFFISTINLGGGTLASGGGGDIFLAKLETSTALPPTPAIGLIVDIEDDQGGQVRIRFTRSGNDESGVSTPIVQYEAFRRIESPPQPLGRRTNQLDDWEFAGAIPAHGETVCNIVVPTLKDSTVSDGQHWSVFFVRAATADPVVFFDSPIDSGYSLDNLAPAPPSGLAYAAGTLTWNEAPEPDFDFFTAYGSRSPDPGQVMTVLDYTANNRLDVGGNPFAYYYVTVTDFAGNEGTPAGVANPLQLSYGVFDLHAFPNPFAPATTISYTLATAASVTLRIYDAGGREVRSIVDGFRQAATYLTAWDGRDDFGTRVATGVYFARLQSGGNNAVRKIVLLK